MLQNPVWLLRRRKGICLENSNDHVMTNNTSWCEPTDIPLLPVLLVAGKIKIETRLLVQAFYWDSSYIGEAVIQTSK